MVCSSHKIYGPKGAGALIASRHIQRRMAPCAMSRMPFLVHTRTSHSGQRCGASGLIPRGTNDPLPRWHQGREHRYPRPVSAASH